MKREDVLEGMRKALVQEARAARRSDAKKPHGRAALNAKLTLHMNDERLYTVALGHTWHQPEDTFVRITIPDRDPIEAYVETSTKSAERAHDGQRSENLVITTSQDLPRQMPAGTRIEPAPDLLFKRLDEALNNPNEGSRSLASKAFGLPGLEEAKYEEEQDDGGEAIPDFQPDRAQQRALRMALDHEVLYVIGPPGTGKTVTLAAMAYQYMRRGMTVLIAAQTNIAVDNAIEQLSRLCQQPHSHAPVRPGVIIRLGQPHLASVRQRKEVNLPALATDKVLDNAGAAARASEQRQAALTLHRDELVAALDELGKERERLRDAVEAARKRSLLARAFTRGSRNHLKTALADIEKQFTDREADLADVSRRLDEGAEEQRRSAVLMGQLERRARALGEARMHGDGTLAGEDDLADGLAHTLFDEEKRILAEARVIGTTLTKTYVSKALKDGDMPRRFDVVIVDEASMASLPALYVAAARADRHVVFIGDPRQLPPIMKARREAETARIWLGTDIFEHASITLEDAAAGRRHAVLLDEQRRMHPAISRVANHVIYDDLLSDHPSASTIKSAIEPLPDHPLMLCDTSTAYQPALRLASSRVNTYHAACAFVLARRA